MSNAVKNEVLNDRAHPEAYFLKVKSPLKNYNAGTATKEDRETLADFYERLRTIPKIATIDGQTYAGNVFSVLPLSVKHANTLIRALIQSPMTDEEDIKELYKINTIISTAVPNSQRTSSSIAFNRESCVRPYRIKIKTATGQEFDFTSDENYNKLLSKVDDVMDTYNIPNYGCCVNAVAFALSRGKEPVNLVGTAGEKFMSAKAIERYIQSKKEK